MEIWRDVIGFEGHYVVSNLGNIRSLGAGKNKNATEKTLRGSPNRFGYLRVNLWLDGKYVSKSIHQLVAIAFIPNPENKRTVNHINGIKSCNCVENLEWNTHQENHRHAFDTGIRKGIKRFGKDNPVSKGVIQMDLSGNMVAIHASQSEAARKSKAHQTKISEVCLGHRKTAGGFKWAFK